MIDNLMSELFGEAAVVLREDFRFVIEAEVHEEMPQDVSAIVPEGMLTVTLKDAGFFLGDQRLKTVEPEYVWLFMACSDDNRLERISRQRVKVVHSPENESMFPLFHVLLAMATWNVKDGEDVDWNEVIRKGPIAISGPRLRTALESGIKEGFVRYVLHQVPQTKPDFLSGDS
jgi:hypothetical protein